MIQKFISKLSDNERKIFYIAIPLVLLALYDRMLIGPILDSTKRADEHLQQEEQVIRANLHFLTYRDRILKESQAFEKYIAKPDVEQKDVARNFLSVLESLATNSGVNLIKSTPSDVEEKDQYIKYHANLDCTGSLENMVKFMHAVNSSDELLKIIRFTMTPKRGGAEQSVSASMTIAKLMVKPE